MKLEVERNRSIFPIKSTDILKLRFDWLERAKVLEEGTAGRLQWYERSEPRGAIGFQVTETGLNLNFQYKLMTGEWIKITQHVLIVVDSSHEIWRNRFVCEACDTVVDELVGFDQHFLCRHCQPLSLSSESSYSDSYRDLKKSGCQVVISTIEQESHRSPLDELLEA